MTPEAFFRTIAKNKRPLIVDVWAPWCAPCRRMNPLLAELQEEYAGQVDVLKVNADESQPLVKQLGILGIPTTLVYRNGQEIGRRTGALGRADLRMLFEAALSEDVVKLPAMSTRTRIMRMGLALIAILAAFVLPGGSFWFVIAGILLFFALYDFIPGVQGSRDRMIKKLLDAAEDAKS